jgi:hypothetical protein
MQNSARLVRAGFGVASAGARTCLPRTNLGSERRGMNLFSCTLGRALPNLGMF